MQEAIKGEIIKKASRKVETKILDEL